MREELQRAAREGYLTPVPGRPLWSVPLLIPRRLNAAVLETLLGALTAMNELYLLERPNTPWLYQAGVRYEREPPGQEQWLPIPFVLLRRDQGGGADCEDLACWRAAELRVKKNERGATAIFTHRQRADGRRLYHIRVRRGPEAGRRVEDPSVALGMGREWLQQFAESHSIVDGDKY